MAVTKCQIDQIYFISKTMKKERKINVIIIVILNSVHFKFSWITVKYGLSASLAQRKVTDSSMKSKNAT